MHGIVFSLLKNYVGTRHGAGTWFVLLKEAGHEGVSYMPTNIYPDEQMADLVAAACRLTRSTRDAVLEDFGHFIAPHLKEMYGFLIDPAWRTRELLLNVEDTVHRVVRLKNPGAEPSELRFSEVDRDTLRFEYDSPRRMAALAIGIMKGVADGYGEVLHIDHQQAADGSSVMMVKIAKA